MEPLGSRHELEAFWYERIKSARQQYDLALTASGSLTEVVRLDGIRGGLTDEELEKFVQSFSIERI